MNFSFRLDFSNYLFMFYFVFLYSYSPNARLEPPRWACALCALGLFIYQSLDAIDGKQARRTNSSSPLGELFDHGCDSISTIFVALSACISAQLGFYPKWMFFQVNFSFTNRFFMQLWLKQCTFTFCCRFFSLLTCQPKIS